jgi:hypothetical protein
MLIQLDSLTVAGAAPDLLMRLTHRLPVSFRELMFAEHLQQCGADCTAGTVRVSSRIAVAGLERAVIHSGSQTGPNGPSMRCSGC